MRFCPARRRLTVVKPDRPVDSDARASSMPCICSKARRSERQPDLTPNPGARRASHRALPSVLACRVAPRYIGEIKGTNR